MLRYASALRACPLPTRPPARPATILHTLLPAVTWRHGKFDNPWATWEERSFRDVLRWNRERRKCASSFHLFVVCFPLLLVRDMLR